MAIAEVDYASMGPRYAPYDPSLPNPWKGLIDGSTNSIYYWNPDTNITQYERPVELAPPLLSGPPKLAPIPTARTPQSNGISQTPHPTGQQALQNSQPQQYMPQQQPHQQMNQQMEHQHPTGQQTSQNSQPQQYMPQQQPHQQINQQQQPHQQINQQTEQQQSQNKSQQTLQQFPHHLPQQIPYQQNPHILSHTQAHQSSQPGHQFMPQQGQKQVVPPRNDYDPYPSQIPQSKFSMTQNPQETRMNQGGEHSYTGDYNSFSKNGPLIPSSTRMLGSSEATSLTAEVYCKKHEISVTGDNVPAPFMTFEATGFPPEILGAMQNAGFFSPTPIQAQTWPIALQAKDIVAIAKTGSGKTLGYLIPAFIHLKRPRSRSLNGPVVLVLAPTRELATQIQEEVVKFGRSSRITCTCLYGGASKAAQLRELDQGVDVVVATPGRLNDILEMKRIDFRQVSFLILDEADRMLDMGFEPQIRTIVREIPPTRQTLMYTATWPEAVRKIAGDLLVNPVQVNIGNVNELAANKSITQFVEVVPQLNKQRRLEEIIRSQERGSKIIIFCSTKKCCDQLSRGMGRTFGAAAIHGDKSQQERDYVLNQFRSGKSPILVATDVAARGLDVKDIRVVINYDFPTGIEDYVHRIGRTGRAGATGVAFTFFCDQDRKHASDLVKVLEGANQIVPPEVRDMAKNGGHFVKDYNRWNSGGRGGRGDSRDGGFNGGRGMRDGSFNGGRGSMRDGGYSGGRGGRTDMRDGGFSGRSDFNNRGGRNDFGGGRGNRGRDFSGSSGSRDDWNGQNSRRGRSYSRSRSPSRSRSRSRNRSRSRSLERVRRSRDSSVRVSKFSSALPVAEPNV